MTTSHLILKGANSTVVVAHGDGPPAITYWGSALDDDPVTVAHGLARPLPHGSIDVEAPVALLPEAGSGFFGSPGIEGVRPDGSAWAPRFQASAPPEVGDGLVRFFCIDPVAALEAIFELRLEPSEDVLQARVSIQNIGHDTYALQRLALSLPLPPRANDILDFTGRWSDEFHSRRRRWDHGAVVNENRRGRTSHDRPPSMFVGTDGFDECHGEVWGFHLGWSGNARLLAERLADGRRHLQIGELLFAGEVDLAPSETVTTPWVYGVYSSAGLGAASRSFHQHLRARPSHPGVDAPRPVLLNTWEAVYFSHNLPTLKALADVAAEIGVERFVLDDGWFRRRNDDSSSLGDWFVDDIKYPDGLGPLIDHVTGLGLEFGLWFEPEMVNPDSDLFRAHPDWVLADSDYEFVLGRNQLVLDLANPEAFGHILTRLDTLLTQYDISYVKWDMNRDHVQAVHDGRAGTRAQTLALYRLLDAVNERHPDVEIESCSSGGGRADFEILRRTKRIWTSDCNDALERLRMQRGFSMVFPPELMGAHIGPHVSHTTRRTHALGFRGASAFLGHLGIEWNVLEASGKERSQLAGLIEIHKQFRTLLHSGDVVRLDVTETSVVAQGVVASDKAEAIFVYAMVDTMRSSVPDPLRFAALDPDQRYRVEIIDLPGRPIGFSATQPPWLDDGIALTGRTLMNVGIQPPILHPETAVVFHLSATH